MQTASFSSKEVAVFSWFVSECNQSENAKLREKNGQALSSLENELRSLAQKIELLSRKFESSRIFLAFSYTLSLQNFLTVAFDKAKTLL